MADWDTAYNWMMDNEDSTRACAQVPDSPPGAFAISGINSASYPAEFAAIAAAPQAEREPLVQQFYENKFWNQWYAQVISDDVGKRVFDFAVNGGSVASVRCLQQAVNAVAAPGAR
jgi:lysozyme family protein